MTIHGSGVEPRSVSPNGDGAATAEQRLDRQGLTSMAADWERAIGEHRANFTMVVDARAAMLRHDRKFLPIADQAAILYPELYKAFPGHDGRVVHVYWPTTIAGGLALTAHKEGSLRRLFGLRRDADTYDLHAVYDSSNADVRLLNLAWRLDQLMIDVRLFLRGAQQRFASDTIYSRYTDILASMDDQARRHHSVSGGAIVGQRKTVVATTRNDHLNALEASVESAHSLVEESAQRQAQGRYLGGMVVSLLSIFLAAGLTAAFVNPVQELASGFDLRTLLGCLIAGATAALLSVLLRIGRNTLRVPWRTGRAMTFLLGLFRPLVGAICGGIAYLLLQSRIISFGAPLSNADEAVFWAVSVLAGFSERFVPDMLTKGTRVTKQVGVVASSQEPSARS